MKQNKEKKTYGPDDVFQAFISMILSSSGGGVQLSSWFLYK